MKIRVALFVGFDTATGPKVEFLEYFLDYTLNSQQSCYSEESNNSLSLPFSPSPS